MAIQVDVFSTARAFAEDELKGKVVAVVDVLRTASTITTALVNGARGVVPVSDMGEASKIAQNLDSSNYLLCGERNGYKIDGYQLGNSPSEYVQDKIKDRTLILNTTNGTNAIRRCQLAKKVTIASFLNLDRVISELEKSEQEVLLVCAGSRNRLAIEDILCAGAIIYGLSGGQLKGNDTDGAKVAFSLYEKFGENIFEVMKHSNHGEWLIREFGEEDISYCSKQNSMPVLPVWKDGVIRLADGS